MDCLTAHSAVPSMLIGLALLKDMPQRLSDSVVLWSLARLAEDSPEHVPYLKRGSLSWDGVNSFFCGCKCPSAGHLSERKSVELDCTSLEHNHFKSSLKTNFGPVFSGRPFGFGSPPCHWWSAEADTATFGHDSRQRQRRAMWSQDISSRPSRSWSQNGEMIFKQNGR